jgi:hypothetical protein
MKEKDIAGKMYLEPELEDILGAKNLGNDYTVEDWPWGRQQRCSMHFFVESTKNGERFVKQSTFKGRTNKPKKATYASRVTIIEIDGKIGRVEWSKSYNHVGVYIEDGRYDNVTFFDEPGKKVVEHFFSS